MSSELHRRQLIGMLAALAACKGAVPTVVTPLPTGPAPIRVVPFLGEGDGAVGVVEGVGLDGRLAFDHAGLIGPERVSEPEFFIRTRAPLHLEPTNWTVDLDGTDVQAADLADAAVDQGAVLLECSGNGSNRRFGLISATTWGGVRLLDQLDLTGDPLIEVVGNDDHPPGSGFSTPGCSWVFRSSELSDAFLATHMDGAPLTPDHGAPVRLVVPGWYGCCNVKWVESVRVVPESSPSTSQMREFASRTHQIGTPDLAADFAPARAQLSAMVIRVEELDDGSYRFHGLAWGERSGRLFLHVDDAVVAETEVLSGPEHTWEYWTVDATVPATGEVVLWLSGEPEVPQLRLDSRFYERAVRLG